MGQTHFGLADGTHTKNRAPHLPFPWNMLPQRGNWRNRAGGLCVDSTRYSWSMRNLPNQLFRKSGSCNVVRDQPPALLHDVTEYQLHDKDIRGTT